MIVGIEELINVVQQNRINNFEVRKDASDSNSTQLRTDDNMTDMQKIELLRNVMQNNYGRFCLLGYEQQSQTKYRHCIEFMIKEQAAQPSVNFPQMNGVGIVPDGYVSKAQVEEMLRNKDLENKLANMENQISELKKEKKELETPVNEFFRSLAPIASTVVSGLVQKQAPTAAVAGLDLPEDTTTEEVDENIQVAHHVEQLMQRWLEADPQAIEMLEKLVVLCETDRGTYDMAKNMLISKI